MATKLTASRDFSLGGKLVPAGSYSLFTIPGKASWTVILNSKPDLSGTNGYDEKNDVARITVTPQAMGASRERLTFLFSDTTDSGTNLDLEWEKTRVRIPITFDTKAQVPASIDKTLGAAWRPHWQAARYLLDSGGDLNQALSYINTSIAIEPNWWNSGPVRAPRARCADAHGPAPPARLTARPAGARRCPPSRRRLP